MDVQTYWDALNIPPVVFADIYAVEFPLVSQECGTSVFHYVFKGASGIAGPAVLGVDATDEVEFHVDAGEVGDHNWDPVIENTVLRLRCGRHDPFCGWEGVLLRIGGEFSFYYGGTTNEDGWAEIHIAAFPDRLTVDLVIEVEFVPEKYGSGGSLTRLNGGSVSARHNFTIAAGAITEAYLTFDAGTGHVQGANDHGTYPPATLHLGPWNDWGPLRGAALTWNATEGCWSSGLLSMGGVAAMPMLCIISGEMESIIGIEPPKVMVRAYLDDQGCDSGTWRVVVLGAPAVAAHVECAGFDGEYIDPPTCMPGRVISLTDGVLLYSGTISPAQSINETPVSMGLTPVDTSLLGCPDAEWMDADDAYPTGIGISMQ